MRCVDQEWGMGRGSWIRRTIPQAVEKATASVTCVGAGVDSAWEQRKLEARKMLENAAESYTSGARFVRCGFV
jgi:DNA/RNA-binding domain of Phe-tRNA-synthetase-like protein